VLKAQLPALCIGHIFLIPFLLELIQGSDFVQHDFAVLGFVAEGIAKLAKGMGPACQQNNILMRLGIMAVGIVTIALQ